METVGNRTLVYSEEFLVPQNENITINETIEGWDLSINISFEPKSNNQGVSIRPNDNSVSLVFQKWDNSLGTCTSEPVLIGTHNSGRSLSFMAANYFLGGTNKFTFQLLIGNEGN
ncbi:hypothetical protein M5216_004481 [Vibrio vulnificus]|nr:hypothetical protein [Vibrio vulnificus]EJE8737721.1 hypothetical protein [Vibrio vulnificus]